MQHKTCLSFESLELATYKSEGTLPCDPSKELDLQYLLLREQIVVSGYYSRISKHLRIRLNGWLKKLDQIIANPLWKKNRNNYAKLINLMCECEVAVEPFLSLPPQADVPKLERHEINKIIDQVERSVKMEKPDKPPTKGKQERQNSLKPQEYWSLIRKANNNIPEYQAQEESIFVGKFASLEDKFKDACNFSKIQGTFHSVTDDNASLKVSEQKGHSSDMKNKESNGKMGFLDEKENISISKTSGNKPPKHIVVSLNPKARAALSQKSRQEGSSGQFKQITIIQDDYSRLQAFRDDHVSLQLQNQTLKTQMFDPDLSIHPHMMPDFSQLSIDCDYTDQLSERVRIEEGQSYLAHRMKERSWQQLPLLPN